MESSKFETVGKGSLLEQLVERYEPVVDTMIRRNISLFIPCQYEDPLANIFEVRPKFTYALVITFICLTWDLKSLFVGWYKRTSSNPIYKNGRAVIIYWVVVVLLCPCIIRQQATLLKHRCKDSQLFCF